MKRPKQHENGENEDIESQDNKDTLSELPDCLLIHILSFLNVKDAVRTSILSSRWEHLWKHLTALTLHSSDFGSIKGFMEFVNGILSLRDNSTALNALDFKCWDRVEPHVLERIYTASHNVNCCLSCDCRRFSPSFLLSCHSLTSLDIGSSNYCHINKFPNSLKLPALTSLKLRYFYFDTESDRRVEPFSTFKRLNTLILYHCIFQDQKTLCISSTTLTLLNLSIYSGSNIELFAPSLCTFALTSNPFPKLSGSHLSSIEQVSIDVHNYEVMPSLDLLNFLVELTNIKSLTVTPTTLQALSLVPSILKVKLTCLCNLKSLNLKLKPTRWRDIKPELANGKSWKENVKLRETIKARLYPKYSSILDGMIEFLLQNSPSAKVDILLESLIEIY